MRLFRFVALLALFAATVSADGISGSWTMKFDGPVASHPICCKDMSINVLVSETSVTGRMVMGDWPGVARITDGSYKDGHLLAKAITEDVSSTGQAQLDFDGTLTGDVLKGTLLMRYPSMDKEKIVAKWGVSGKKAA
jgi:hypothetical protein